MTRINLVPPSELHKKHLMGEYYELPRVFTAVSKAVAKGKTPSDYSHVPDFRLGPGHVIFFYTRLGFLQDRFNQLVTELLVRNYKINKLYLDYPDIPQEWYGTWTPSPRDIDISRSRINERLKEMGVL